MRSFLQVAIVTLGTVFVVTTLLIAISPFLGGSALGLLQRTAAGIKEWTDGLSLGLTALGLFLGLSGLFWIAYRARRSKLREALNNEHRRQMQALLAKARAGELEAIPPLAEMTALGELLAQINSAIARNGQQPDLVKQRTAFETAYRFMDLDRRIGLNEMPIVNETLEGIWPRLRLFVFSDGVEAVRDKSAKLVGRVGTAAACIATIGVSAPVIVSGGVQPVITSIFELQLTDKARLVRSDLAALANAPLPPGPRLPASNVYRPVAREFTRQVAVALSAYMDADRAKASPVQATSDAAPVSPQPGGNDSATGSASDLDGLALRDAVLSEYAAGVSGSASGRPVSLSANLATVSDRARTRYSIFKQDLTAPTGGAAQASSPNSSGAAGQRLERWLNWVAARNPAMKAKLKAFVATTAQPRPMSSFQEAVLGEFVSRILENALPEPDMLGAFAGKQVGKTARKGLEAGVSDFALGALNDFLRGVAGPATVQLALNRIGAARVGERRFTDDERDALANYFADLQSDQTQLASSAHDEPTLSAAVDDASRTRKIGESLSTDAGAASVQEVAGGYADLFPGSAADAGHTALASVTRKDGGETTEAIVTARDFARLSKDAHVGGVVIGRDATGKGQFVDLRWNRRGTQFDLVLEDSGGRSRPLGLFDGTILQQAIAYAADGRQTAVTIVNAATLSGVQKIHLHPVFQNTTLGCWLMDLDSMVFDETRSDPRWREWSDRVDRQTKLYTAAVAMFHEVPTREPEDRSELSALFPSGWDAADRKVSVFASEPAVYSLTLAQALANCKATTGSYWRCVENDYTQHLTSLSVHKLHNEEMTVVKYRGSTDPALLSGVREIDYSPLVTAFMPGRNFRSVLHFAYLAVVPGTAGNDTPPWEFPVLGNQAERMVDRLAATHPERAEVLSRTIEFTVAQRLARAGLQGALGPAFPRTRFLELMRAAKAVAPVPNVSTPIWTVTRLQDAAAGRTGPAASASPGNAFANAQGNLSYLSTLFEKRKLDWQQMLRRNSAKIGEKRAGDCLNALKTSQLSTFDVADVTERCQVDPGAFKDMKEMVDSHRFLAALLANSEPDRFASGARCPATRSAS